MAQKEVEFAELHTPLFLSGTNLGVKLEPAKKTGLKLLYDRENKELAVFYNGKAAILTNNVASVTYSKPDAAGFKNATPEVKPVAKVTTKGAATTKGAPFTAQVETPHGLTRSKL